MVAMGDVKMYKHAWKNQGFMFCDEGITLLHDLELKKSQLYITLLLSNMQDWVYSFDKFQESLWLRRNTIILTE